MTNEEAIKVLTHVMMVAKAMDDTKTGLALTRAIEVLKANTWRPIESAPKYGKTFLCRRKNEPHVTFEAFIDKESESWEMPNEYDILCNESYPEDILDDCWSMYEWQPLESKEIK